MRIAVIGTGYLGATHAACMAQIGHDVLGVDIDPGKVAKLQSGEVPFFEPGIEDIVRDNLASGRLRFTDSYVESGKFRECVLSYRWHATNRHGSGREPIRI